MDSNHITRPFCMSTTPNISLCPFVHTTNFLSTSTMFRIGVLVKCSSKCWKVLLWSQFYSNFTPLFFKEVTVCAIFENHLMNLLWLPTFPIKYLISVTFLGVGHYPVSLIFFRFIFVPFSKMTWTTKNIYY